jgi:hypothetical protein
VATEVDVRRHTTQIPYGQYVNQELGRGNNPCMI